MLGKRVPLVPARRVHGNLTQAESLHDRTFLTLNSTNRRYPRRARKDGHPVESYRRSPSSPSGDGPSPDRLRGSLRTVSFWTCLNQMRSLTIGASSPRVSLPRPSPLFHPPSLPPLPSVQSLL